MFTTLEHILIHTSFSITSIVICIYMMTLLICQIIKLQNSQEKGMIDTFFSTSEIFKFSLDFFKTFTIK